jgi:hypothetical protein
MMNFRIGMPLALAALLAVPAAAQNAVQLPTYSSFRTNTTISVPDRGSVYTGGINRAADGRNQFGTPLLPFRIPSTSGLKENHHVHNPPADNKPEEPCSQARTTPTLQF